MSSLNWIDRCALVAVAITTGCGQSIPSKPPRPVNALYQNGPTKEGTLETSTQSLQQGLLATIEKAGWKAVTSDIAPSEGAIEAEAKKGERVEIRYESRGEKSTFLGIKGTPTTPKPAVETLYDKIQKGHS